MFGSLVEVLPGSSEAELGEPRVVGLLDEGSRLAWTPWRLNVS